MKILLEDTQKKIKNILKEYEDKRSSLIPVLHVVQNDYGYIPEKAITEIAELLKVKPGTVEEIITFYSMFKSKPLGKYHIQLCRNIVCYLNGGKELIDFLEEKYGLKPGTYTKDKKFSLTLVECLGHCEIAPVVQINKEFYGNLNPEKLETILTSLE